MALKTRGTNMKKFTIALALAATVVSTPVMASPGKGCPGSVAQRGGDVAAWVALILSRFGTGQVFGSYCGPK